MSLEGKNVGRYRVIEQLGQGGMAVVYRAFDTRLERDVAIKVIRTENILPVQLEHFLQRFEREAKTQSRFNHPNIVQVFDYGEYEGSPYLVMAYVSQGTLKKLIDGSMTYQNAARLLAPIADALTYAHERDVLHRDIKPSNILLDESGKPMLTDFGIAKLLGDVDEVALTSSGIGVGTPQYMAPEQWQGKAVKATDVYALGIVFYELITGRKPYDADTPAALILLQANDPLPKPSKYAPGLPQHVEDVIYKALAPAPEDRYQSMADFANALHELSLEQATPGTLEEEMKTILRKSLEPILPYPVEAGQPGSGSGAPVGQPPSDSKPQVRTQPPQRKNRTAQTGAGQQGVRRSGSRPAAKSKFNAKLIIPAVGCGLAAMVLLVGVLFGAWQIFGKNPGIADSAAATTEVIPTDTLMPSEVVIEPTATLFPTDTPPPTFTPLPELTPENANNGEHRYAVTKTEGTCTLTISAPEQTRTITFTGETVVVSHSDGEGSETYDSIGNHRYMRINNADRPVVVEFTFDGFYLQIYESGDDVNIDSPCGYFTFTIID